MHDPRPAAPPAPATPAGVGRSLTPRERAVLDLLAAGWPNKRIARELGIGISTVKTHVAHIFERLEVTNRTEATLWRIERRDRG